VLLHPSSSGPGCVWSVGFALGTAVEVIAAAAGVAAAAAVVAAAAAVAAVRGWSGSTARRYVLH
jgi:hypothetical protein